MSYTGRSLKKNGSIDGLKERNQKRKTTLSYIGRSFAPIKPIEKEKNRGSHAGYVLGNVGIGLMQPLEGIYKFLVGTTAQLTGDKAYAKYIYSKSLTGDWSEALNKSYNPGKGMAFVGDVATGLGQSVTYAGMAMATGGVASAAGASGVVLSAAQGAPILFSGAGSGTAEAVQRTGNLTHRENLYGLGSGFMEMGLEKLSSVGGAVGRLTGTSGVTEKMFSKVIRNSVARGIVSDAAGEFAEEALSELGSTWLLRITGVDKEARTNAGNMFRAGIVGAFSGAIMGGATAGTARQVRINAGKRIQANQTAEATVQAAKSLMDAVKGAGLSAELQDLRSAVNAYTALENKNSRAALEKLGQIAEKMLSIEGKSHIGALTARFMADAENTVEVINLQIPKPGGGKWTVEDIRRNEGNITSMYASLVHANRLMMLSESYAQSIDALVKEGQAEAMKATEAENVQDIMNMHEKGERYIVRDMGEGRYGVVFRTSDGKYNVGVYQNGNSSPEIVENVNSAKEAYALLMQKGSANQTAETAAQGDGPRFSPPVSTKPSAIENFQRRLEAWDGKTQGFSFVMGETPAYLAKLDVQGKKIGKKQVRIDASKVKKILNDHPEMTIDVIKKLPEILYDPIVVLDSKTVTGSLVLYGEVYGKNGRPVMMALEISPSTKKGDSSYVDIIKVSGAYTRTNTQNIINTSKIRYVSENKNRVNDWLKVNRLQLPLPNSQSDSATVIIQDSEQNVNTKGERKFSPGKTQQTVKNAAQTSQTEKDEQTPHEGTENATESENGGENGQITDADRTVARGLLKDYDMLSAEVQRKIASMVQSGLRAGASKQQMKEAACLIRELKVMIAFSADITSEGLLAKMDGESIILIHPKKQNRSNTLLHELTHRLRSASYYSTLAKTVKEAVGEKVFAAYKEAYRKDYDSYRESEAQHGRHIEALTEEALEEDATADICADYLGKLDFIRNYCDDSLIRRIFRRLRSMRAVLKTDNREYLEAAKKIEKAYEKLLVNQAFGSEEGTERKRYSPPSAASDESEKAETEDDANKQSSSGDGSISGADFWAMMGGNEAMERRDPAFQAEMKRRRIALGLEKETKKEKQAREKEEEAEKYYTKKDAAETVDDIFDETLSDLAKQYGVTITAAAKERANEQLWLALNRASQKERERACQKIAEALMESIVLTENEGSRRAAYDEALHEYETLKQYRHNIFVKNLGAPREEKTRLLLQWSNEESKYNVWDVKREAAENGVILQGDTQTDLLREIDSRCRTARNTAAKKAYRAALKEFDGEVDLNALKNNVVAALMQSFDDKGKVKPYADIEAYQRSADALEEARIQVKKFKHHAKEAERDARAKIRTAAFEGEKAIKLRNYIEKNLLAKMRDTFSNRKYLSSDEMLNKQFKTIINLFTVGITPEQFCESRKRARVVVQEFATFYKLDNPVLANVSADKETLFTDDQMVGYIDPLVVDAIQAFLSVDEAEPLRIEDWENLKTIVGGAKKLFERYDAIKFNGKTQNLTELIEKETDILSYVKNRNLVTGSNGLKKVLARLKRAGWQYAINVVDPITVVGALTGFDESSALYQMINELRMAEDRRICMHNELMAPIEAYLKSNKKYKKRLAEETLKLKGVEITVGEAISAVMTSKRRQAWDSLSISGFRVEREKTGETLEIRGLTEADFAALEKSLSEEDRQMIKLCESFFEEARQKKIKTDEEILGYTSILEGYYFPLARAEDTVARKGDLLDNRSRFEEFFLSTSNLSFNKKTKLHVKSQLKLSNVFDVVSRHADGLSAYATLYAPLQDLNRLYNKNIGESSNIITVKKLISDSVEKDAHNYLVNLINGLQGRKTISKGNAAMGKMRSLFTTSVLGFKLDTICKQISSLPMALTYVKASSLARGITIKVDDAVLDKYSIAAKARAYDKTVVKAEGVLDKVGDFANATTAGIQWMDRKVVKRLFGAAQAEIESTEGDPIGSEANLQKAGKLLDKIIHDTQGNSLAMERSALMRSESEFLRSFTMFMSDSMKQLSRIFESIWRLQALSQRAKAKDGKVTQAQLDEARTQLGKSIAAVLTSTTVFVLIGQLFKWLYAKDRKNAEGETVSVLEDTTKEFAMQLIGTLPIISAASDFFIDGWPVSSFAVDMVNDVLDSTKRLYEAAFDPEKTAEQQRLAFKKAIHATLSMVGLPSENVEKTLTGLAKRFNPAAAYRYNNLFYDSRYAQDLAAANEGDKDRLAGTIIELAYEKRTGDTSAAVVDEVLRLYKLGYTELLAQDIPDSIKVAGENVTLTRKQKNAYTNAFNSFDCLPKLIESASFKALTDEERAAAIKRANQLAASYAKNKVFGTEMSAALATASFIEPTLLAIAAAGCTGIKSDVDKNGKTVPGSRKMKVMTYLKRLGMTDAEQAIFLYAVLGYRSSELKDAVKATAANATAEIKNALGIN